MVKVTSNPDPNGSTDKVLIKPKDFDSNQGQMFKTTIDAPLG
jgi:hypothetical protein